MSDDDRILDLLVEYEERRARGEDPRPEDLVPDDPALCAALRHRLEKRRRVRALVEPTTDPETAAASDAAFPTIAGFEILGVLGRGGMGVVYKARQTRLNRLVALKMILSGATATAHERARFKAEAEAVARLHHPQIVQIYEVGEADGRPYLALEYLDGGSLADRLDGAPLPSERAAALVETLARAIQHAHAAGVVHRDLKPGNILLASGIALAPRVRELRNTATKPDSHPPDSHPRGADATPLAKIADFGLAKTLDSDATQTRTGTVLGSPRYMAPEQAAGRLRDVGPAADVWALGVILYELVTGKPPFDADTALATLHQVRETEPPSPRAVNPAVPRDLEKVVLKCLEKEPPHRYASAAALADDLQRFLAGETVAAQPASLFDRIGHAVGRQKVDVRFGAWARLLLFVAPLPFLIQLALLVSFGDRRDYGQIAAGVTVAAMFCLQLVVFDANRALVQSVSVHQRRHVLNVFRGFLVAVILIVIIVGSTAPADEPERFLLVFPLCMILCGQMFLSMAARNGSFYVFAAVVFAASLVAALLPRAGPLLMGTMATANFVIQGLLLRRLGREEE